MSNSASRLILVAATAGLFTAGLYACGGNSDDVTFARAKGGSSGTSADSSTGGGGNSNNGGSGGGFFIDAPFTDQGMNSDTACAGEKVVAEVLPLDLYLMVDRSASMSNSGKWTNQSAALKSFIGAPESDGLFLALRFFPLNDNCGPQDQQCSGNAYINPLVDWGELPGHAGDLNNAINGTGPDGCFTPTQEALNGVLGGAKQRQLAVPDHVVAAVIVSDGTPCCTDCPYEESSQLGQIAGTFATGTPPIKTFAIFVDDSASDVMNAIAAQGGTTAPYDATSGQQAFLDALEKIRGSALGCEYKFPKADGGKADPKLVQITYTADPGGTPTDLKQVASKADCGTGDGWYYDDNANPTKITLCDNTCSTVRNDKDGEISILVGCSHSRY
jgi:hypothetical protein